MAELTNMDYQIISCLQEDGRMPTVEIARRIGVSEGTVRRRLANLIQHEVLRVTAVVNPLKVGFHFSVYFGLSIEMDRFKEITQTLASLREIRFVHFLSGAYDIWISAWFVTMDDVVAFVTDKLASIPGVRRIETFYVQKEIKRSHLHDQEPLILLRQKQTA